MKLPLRTELLCKQVLIGSFPECDLHPCIDAWGQVGTQAWRSGLQSLRKPSNRVLRDAP